MEEPSVLDYFKQKLNPKNWGKKVEDYLPERPVEESAAEDELIEAPTAGEDWVTPKILFPWKILLALFLALAAQRMLEPTTRNVIAAVVLYAGSLGMILLAVIKKEWFMIRLRSSNDQSMGTEINTIPFLISLPVALLAFVELKDNRFTALNLCLWIAAIALAVWAFWKKDPEFHIKDILNKVWNFIRKPFVEIHFSGWTLLCIAVFALGVFFHFYKLSTVPYDMTSDHAEKLLDINDILHGTYPLFFARNGGREPIEFYLCSALIKWFGATLSFTTLKLCMGLVFLVGMIFMYKVGKELGNRWTGLIAMLFLGFASWTNIISRIGLRLVLYPVFTAIVFYFLLRGFRRMNRNDFVLAGICLGLGLLGYSAFRIVPFVVVMGVIIYILHQKERSKRKEAVWALGIMTFFAVVLALPLIHFAIQYPDAFGYRTITRITSAEVPLSGNVFTIFLSNTWNALMMPFYDDGSTWVIAVTGRPALDVVTAALYFIGLVVAAVRWVKSRNWQDLFMILSIPALMLPSIMALAFPNENPSLSRTGGAIIPIMFLVALGLQSLSVSLWEKCRNSYSKVLVVVLALGLAFLSARQNYDLFYNQYNTGYANATWNTRQIGEVCKGYIESMGDPDTCYVVGLAYWVDTRLVSMVAGYPTLDNAIWPEDIKKTLDDPRGKMFIVRSDHTEALQILQTLFPNGFSTLHTSDIPGRSFIAYQVPPTSVETGANTTTSTTTSTTIGQ